MTTNQTTHQIIAPGSETGRALDYQAWKEGEEVPWIEEVFAILDGASDTYKKYQVHWEPNQVGDWELTRHDIPRDDYQRLYYVFNSTPPSLERDPGYGEITALRHQGRVWMSDTRAEIMEHAPLLDRLWFLDSIDIDTSVLINGLGLGMAVNAVLLHGATHVDVVELSKEVIEIVGPNFADDPRVTIHHADAFEITWPRGTRWTLAWHDIWPDIDSNNLPQMRRLHERYRRRTEWQGSWQRDGCLRVKRNQDQLAKALEAGDWARVKELDPDF